MSIHIFIKIVNSDSRPELEPPNALTFHHKNRMSMLIRPHTVSAEAIGSDNPFTLKSEFVWFILFRNIKLRLGVSIIKY